MIAGQPLLTRLVAESLSEMVRRRAYTDQSELVRSAAAYTPLDFAAVLRSPGLAVIAEMKQRTPSMGVLAKGYRPERLARAYSEAGASALSVLTQEASFGGSAADLRKAREVSALPILRKDFIVDPYQVLEAKALGADAVLLIAAALRERLRELLAVAREHGLAALVEVHDERETASALEAGAELIGVNHRDLNTFEIDLTLTERLRPSIPREVTVVAESGIRGREDARRMREAGADAILVGELLMRSSDPAACIRDLASA